MTNPSMADTIATTTVAMNKAIVVMMKAAVAKMSRFISDQKVITVTLNITDTTKIITTMTETSKKTKKIQTAHIVQIAQRAQKVQTILIAMVTSMTKQDLFQASIWTLTNRRNLKNKKSHMIQLRVLTLKKAIHTVIDLTINLAPNIILSTLMKRKESRINISSRTRITITLNGMRSITILRLTLFILTRLRNLITSISNGWRMITNINLTMIQLIHSLEKPSRDSSMSNKHLRILTTLTLTKSLQIPSPSQSLIQIPTMTNIADT